MTPEQEQPKAELVQQRTPQPLPEEAAMPKAVSDFRLKQRVTDVLAATPRGAQLDRYFGITSGSPEQPIAEAEQSDALIEQLRSATNGEGGDLESLLGDISKHAASSGAYADALRALMRGTRKTKSGNEEQAG